MIVDSLFRPTNGGFLVVETGANGIGIEAVFTVGLLRRSDVHEADDGAVGVESVDLLDAAEAKACRR